MRAAGCARANRAATGRLRKETMNIQDQNTESNNPTIAVPVKAQERVEILDIIRGFALLGILMANMALFSSPADYLGFIGKSMWTGFWDTIVSSLISIFIHGKFYTMFSLR